MTAKEWLGVMQQAEDYNPAMTKLIEKYGQMLLDEHRVELEKEVERLKGLIENLFIELWKIDTAPQNKPLSELLQQYKTINNL